MPEPTEAAITKAVVQHWRAFRQPNTLVASIPSMGAMGQAGLTRGLPDLLVIGGSLRGGVGFIELKRDGKARVRPEQEAFRLLAIANGVPCVVTRGRDEPIAMLEGWGVVRRRAA